MFPLKNSSCYGNCDSAGKPGCTCHDLGDYEPLSAECLGTDPPRGNSPVMRTC